MAKTANHRKLKYTNIMKILSDEAKEYLTEVLGDLEVYVYNRIEANVKLTK